MVYGHAFQGAVDLTGISADRLRPEADEVEGPIGVPTDQGEATTNVS